MHEFTLITSVIGMSTSEKYLEKKTEFPILKSNNLLPKKRKFNEKITLMKGDELINKDCTFAGFQIIFSQTQ